VPQLKGMEYHLTGHSVIVLLTFATNLIFGAKASVFSWALSVS